jgi:hypothetical protein
MVSALTAWFEQEGGSDTRAETITLYRQAPELIVEHCCDGSHPQLGGLVEAAQVALAIGRSLPRICPHKLRTDSPYEPFNEWFEVFKKMPQFAPVINLARTRPTQCMLTVQFRTARSLSR